jgi:hypothetical protein
MMAKMLPEEDDGSQQQIRVNVRHQRTKKRLHGAWRMVTYGIQSYRVQNHRIQGMA